MAALSPQVDGTLFTISSGRVDAQSAEKTLDQLMKSQGTLLGAALTFVKRTSGAKKYYAYRYRYASTYGKKKS